MVRQLTTRFFSYTMGQYEKKTGKSPIDIMDIGNLELSKICTLIMLGNKGCSEEDAYEKLDTYLYNDDEHSLMTAYFDLLTEYDKDLRILKSCGISVDDLKENFKSEMKNSKHLFAPKAEVEENIEG